MEHEVDRMVHCGAIWLSRRWDVGSMHTVISLLLFAARNKQHWNTVADWTLSCDVVSRALGRHLSPRRMTSSHLTDCVVALSPLKSSSLKDRATCRQTTPVQSRRLRHVTDKNIFTASKVTAVSRRLHRRLCEHTITLSLRCNWLIDMIFGFLHLYTSTNSQQDCWKFEKMLKIWGVFFKVATLLWQVFCSIKLRRNLIATFTFVVTFANVSWF